MEKLILTLNILNTCKPGIILATGKAYDTPEGLNMYSNTGMLLTWVLKIGQAGDWAVYCSNHLTFDNDIAASGDKVRSIENLRNIIEFKDEVWERYRR